MTRESVRERHRLLVEKNWKEAGRTRIEDILEEGKQVRSFLSIGLWSKRQEPDRQFPYLA